MPDKSTMNDPQTMWQNQPTEAFKMSIDQLRAKAQKRQRELALKCSVMQLSGPSFPFLRVEPHQGQPCLVGGGPPAEPLEHSRGAWPAKSVGHLSSVSTA